jgi:GPH family glycoside/pentoside/hexuronide:cation symporter
VDYYAAMTRIGYGAAEMGHFASELVVRLYLLKFYTDIAGLSPSLAGLAIALSITYDAISDPIMGYLSDHTSWSIGRRRPFILAGSLFLAVALVILFHPSPAQSQTVLFFYLLFSYISLNTALTVTAVPHAALAAELTDSPAERTVLFGFRLFWGNIGLLAGTLLPGYFLSKDNAIEAYRNASLTLALLVAAGGLITFLTTSERHSGQKRRAGAVSEFTSVLTNPLFRPLLLSFMTAYAGVAINSALALFYYEDRLRFKPDQINLVLGLFLIVWTLSIPLWVYLSKRYGKRRPAFYGILLLGLMTTFTYPFFPAGVLWPPVIAAVAGGIFVGSIILFDSIITDIADYDEWKTGVQKEGLFFGFAKMGVKLSRALALLLTGFLLEAIGSGEARNIVALGWLFGPGVGVFFLAGSAIFLLYPMTDKQAHAVQKRLKRRRNESQGIA